MFTLHNEPRFKMKALRQVKLGQSKKKYRNEKVRSNCFIFAFHWPLKNSFQCNRLAVLIFCMVSSFKKCNFCIGPHCWRYLTMGWTSFSDFHLYAHLSFHEIFVKYTKCNLNRKNDQKYRENTVAQKCFFRNKFTQSCYLLRPRWVLINFSAAASASASLHKQRNQILFEIAVDFFTLVILHDIY